MKGVVWQKVTPNTYHFAVIQRGVDLSIDVFPGLEYPDGDNSAIVYKCLNQNDSPYPVYLAVSSSYSQYGDNYPHTDTPNFWIGYDYEKKETTT